MTNLLREGHKCDFKETQLFTVEIPTTNSDDEDELVDFGENEGTDAIATDPYISVCALSGNQNYNTMRVTGI